MLNRGIDHLVLCAGDLESQREFYERLGFTVTPKGIHSWGTANALVQLEGCFLELLTVADPTLITEHGPDFFGFGAHNRDYLSGGEGLSMLVFEGHDARGDRAEFSDKGLDTYEPFDFERKARQPDGTEVTVGFSLTFVTHPDMPRTAFFTCQQHAPEYFWKPEYQRHANTARTVTEVVMVADRPTDYAGFFEKLQGPGCVTENAGLLIVTTARGTVLVLDEKAWRDSHEGASIPDLSGGPQIASYTVGVSDFTAAGDVLRNAGVDHTSRGDRLVVGPDDAFGVFIEFAPVEG